ncbi:PATS1-like protein [Mya arenaria]|uniref:non-specific serine/threonine protein kinase n=1 Tax=Mya arenaria TaxID=6604 RepID=A0ABY7G3I6_MYAAR|nr:PATS1-like protein [Mya arenaria]
MPQYLQKVAKINQADLGCVKVESTLNTGNILYICEGHHASVKIDEGFVNVLPEVYGKYSHFLLSVDIPANKITKLPSKMFKALPNLAEFDCSNNFLDKIPSTIGCCKKLYSLSCATNNLENLPESLTQCKEIHRLDISENTMSVFPPVVTKLTSLRRIYANCMFLAALPENIGDLVHLEKLYANGNCFSSLPKSFTKLQALNDLGMYGVPLLPVPKARKVMSYDQFMSKIKMWKLDRWLNDPKHTSEKERMFQYFDKDNNGVLDADEVCKLNAYLFNLFPRFGYKGSAPPDDDTPSGFPMELLECRSLEYINLYFHGFVSIPPEIENLQELRMLNVSNNPNLLSVPAELGKISTLIRMDFDSCASLHTPPKEIRAKGFSVMYAYLRSMISGSVPCKRTKLMLVGLGGAGKTSLVEALMSKDGKANLSHGEAITDGIDISNWTVRHEDESLTYSVWDFAGQTVYYNTHQFFLSNRAVYLLLWNVRLGYEHAGLDFWLSSISVQAPKAPIFVIGSHVDQVSKFEIPMNEMRERYKQIAGFHFVSSYTGKGIMELQQKLFSVTLEQQYMGEQIPEVWLQFENNVIGTRSKSNVMEYTELEKLANISGIFDKIEVHQAVRFLHDLGSLQHFTTEKLKTKVVINPQWIVDVMACVVSVKNSPIQNGRLNHSDIGVVWKDYPADLHDWLLELTEAYDLTFRLDDKPVNLVPCLMPEKQPDFQWEDVEKNSGIKENKMIYKFDYLPAGLFNRGQVRLHQISDSAHIWKRGSFLHKNGHRAVLIQNRESELILRVQGPRPENVIFLVHEVFEGLISESFRGVTYDFQIPCPNCLAAGVKDMHMFSASTIRRAIALKSPFLQCVTYFHVTSCNDLLASMPPDSHSDFDIHLVQSIRSLRDLRKDLAADLFLSYCAKDAPKSRKGIIHPAQVCEDLRQANYKCWFPKPEEKMSAEEMAHSLSDAAVFVVFMSVNYAQDKDCVDLFKFARLTLKKPMVVVAVGENFDWKKGVGVGFILADEVFVNMINSKVGVYDTKLKELKETIASRMTGKVSMGVKPPCFFSYTWVNSANAVAQGTRKLDNALGYADPRGIRDFLEENNVKCWIDVEQVGKNGLFDDISSGLLSARVVVVCVSDQYADSETCQREFRYAANTLGLPVILAVVGKGNRWRNSEVGVLSLKYPLVSFQEKSDTAYENLLALVRQEIESQGPTKEQKNAQNDETKNMSFTELFELAQRKLLRQLSLFAENQDIGAYPRLFVVDFLKRTLDEDADKDETEDTKDEVEVEEKKSKPKLLKRMSSVDQHTFTKKISELKAAFRVQRYCLHILCEHEEGWHSVSDPISLPHDFGETLLDRYSPFVSRMLAVMKFNKNFSLNCLQHEMGDDYLKWLEESPAANISDYQQIYHDFRQIVKDLDEDTQKAMGKLSRCRLQNGKTIWLCNQHLTSMKATVLSMDDGSSEGGEKVLADDQRLVQSLRAFPDADLDKVREEFQATKLSKRNPDALNTAVAESKVVSVHPGQAVKPTKYAMPQTESEKEKEVEIQQNQNDLMEKKSVHKQEEASLNVELDSDLVRNEAKFNRRREYSFSIGGDEEEENQKETIEAKFNRRREYSFSIGGDEEEENQMETNEAKLNRRREYSFSIGGDEEEENQMETNEAKFNRRREYSFSIGGDEEEETKKIEGTKSQTRERLEKAKPKSKTCSLMVNVIQILKFIY